VIGHYLLAIDTSPETFEQLLRGFLGRGSAAAEIDMGSSLDTRVLDSISLGHNSEGLIGLENLCSNLDDYEVAVSEQERNALLAFADAWNLGERDRSRIKSLRST
jgi:hypothetical protein